MGYRGHWGQGPSGLGTTGSRKPHERQRKDKDRRVLRMEPGPWGPGDTLLGGVVTGGQGLGGTGCHHCPTSPRPVAVYRPSPQAWVLPAPSSSPRPAVGSAGAVPPRGPELSAVPKLPRGGSSLPVFGGDSPPRTLSVSWLPPLHVFQELPGWGSSSSGMGLYQISPSLPAVPVSASAPPPGSSSPGPFTDDSTQCRLLRSKLCR